MKRIVLITGGNKGLGFDTAKVLQQKGYNVYIGSRDAERGRQAADELGVKYVQLDVTDDISIQQAYLQIQDREGRLDILINNAGISGGFKKPADLTVNDVQQVYNTNVFGIVRMMHTFIPLLEKSEQPVVVNVSSGLGSFGMVTNPNTQESKVNSLAYCSSKSAVTMITLQYAKGLPHIQINAADPGSTNTDLVGDFSNNAKPASEGIIPIVKLATIDKDGPTGTFIDSNGSMPW
ncbi:SDR family NAD(P)-dependent oxidoreductase [Staphylococcus lugdunensis]|uniref:SDR family NAD(P)-dependent oxidoreductase n=1 Tax=Staphylococcus lugdunensis TaxID=28035 RepID=UPI000A10DADB|nr:SDR family NAD(P)-dependent oxidoreductase [Staphylococcus lugdunensis]ARJ26475.1 short-chain dehydrogenase [Staphylococcus lugdunensis]MCH8672563.1 SDR family NAD(P)-dependent oxidoreductase [Staphylococcus lugdunensis]MCH8675881.1 SDR family NAD(P)-dependent oxidoreductase [Staphylococcus lugdunensis]MCI2752775.1 SDR family NAD(P)-dependent oxidoreductase [Staphylococcus lugdunensis]MCI2761545.1 SDR family NAD(P)-dependent oxidoreductase [Staphylococcus lugdunensis]